MRTEIIFLMLMAIASSLPSDREEDAKKRADWVCKKENCIALVANLCPFMNVCVDYCKKYEAAIYGVCGDNRCVCVEPEPSLKY
ncbi:hypothetical protein JTB14_035633 [Gonioctena quinquepunctata]|nr:hypothetical protein JTB14_035633 [Gonioctena quinquepunctata]